MRQRLQILLVLSFFVFSKITGQTFEVGGFAGVSNYMGDLQQSDFEYETTHEAYGFFVRYNVNKQLGLKAHLYKGKISGNDAHYPELKNVRERNLSFRSNLYELGLQAEVTLVSFGERKKMAAPFIYTGLNVFYFNPQANYQGRWVDLQPLGTEGQGQAGNPDKYNRLQISIPIGIGFFVRIAERMNLGFEVGFRKTFTDYIDDVSGNYPNIAALEESSPMTAALSFRSPEIVSTAGSNPQGRQRGSAASKDMYFFGGVTFSYVLFERLGKRKKRYKYNR